MNRIVLSLMVLAVCVSCSQQFISLPKLYDSLSSTVVTIDGRGSGVLVRKDLVLTANHVVVDGENFVVVLRSTAKISGRVIVRDVNNDLALIELSLDDVRWLNVPKLNFNTYPEIGEQIFMISSPYMFAGTLSTGIVSRRSTIIEQSPWTCDLFLTDNVGAPGSSGGPVFNMRGDVVGVHVGHIDNLSLMIPSYSVCCFLRANGL